MNIFRRTFASRDRSDEGGEVDRAIAAWGESELERERLSGAARTRILALARDDAEPVRGLTPLFTPVRHLALTAALPIVALTLILGTLVLPSPEYDRGGHAPRVEAIKDAGEILFVIANGSPRHRVTRSSAPDGASEGVFTTIEGSFRVKIDDGSDVVFYRID